ncbi:hypothetical protein [Rhodococcus sovatensis]|uniref:Uncharacterized protein n=1 Tax=Rhodococcus sovatensis TaxID=1805840 RepID=A0ABZ2PH31_9NOCA
MGTHSGVNCPRSALRTDILQALGASDDLPQDLLEPEYGPTWTRDGIDGVELTWTVPDQSTATEAWFLKPATTCSGDLPAVLLMHGHDGTKFYGKEKVADGPDGPAPGIPELRKHAYDGRSVAAGLVAAGFAVLVHDAFPWGSRRIRWDEMPERARKAADMDERRYEAAAREHEHGLAKVAALTGSSLAGQVLHEDLVALNVLRSLPGVDPSRIATTGFSGGGARVTHLLAAADVTAAVVTAMTSTFIDIADGHADDTTWLMITPGLPAVCDWPDVVASGFPTPLLVQFARDDTHFGIEGMRDAEAALERAYAGTEALVTQWFSHGHQFSTEMQDEVALWLQRHV